MRSEQDKARLDAINLSAKTLAKLDTVIWLEVGGDAHVGKQHWLAI